MHIHDMYLDANTIYCGGFGGAVYIGNVDKDDWIEKKIMDISIYISVIRKNGNYIYAGSATEGIFMSDDEGETWDPINIGLSNLSIYSLHFREDIILAGTSDALYTSTNNGAVWVRNASEIGAFYSLAKSRNTILSGTQQGIFTSTDKGTTWRKNSWGVETGNIFLLAAATNSNMVYASNGNTMYISANNGEAWKEESKTVKNRYIHNIVAHGSIVFAALYGEGVYVSTDNGSTWAAYNNGISNLRIDFLSISGNTVIAGTSEGDVWKTDITSLISSVNNIENKTAPTISIYPNPVSGNVTIVWDKSLEFESEFSILNNIGEGVLVGHVPSGNNTYYISTESFPAGSYTLLLNLNGNKTLNKFSIIR